jgi:signal transduction histidine kinase
MRDVLTLIEPLARSKDQTLRTRIGRAPARVRADDRRLRQILLNLLSNALKFTPDGGLIVVEAAGKGGFLEFTVADNGIGIAAEELARIFYPFLQEDGSYNRRQEGTGLGLSLTRELVELHGGRIWVESLKGHGSRFSFTIPLSARAPARRTPVPGPGPTVSAGPLDATVVVTLDEAAEAGSTLQEPQRPPGGR